MPSLRKQAKSRARGLDTTATSGAITRLCQTKRKQRRLWAPRKDHSTAWGRGGWHQISSGTSCLFWSLSSFWEAGFLQTRVDGYLLAKHSLPFLPIGPSRTVWEMDPCPFIFYMCTYVCPCGGREQLVGVNSLLLPHGSWGLTPSSVLVANTFTCWAILSVFYGWIQAVILVMGNEISPLQKQEVRLRAEPSLQSGSPFRISLIICFCLLVHLGHHMFLSSSLSFSQHTQTFHWLLSPQKWSATRDLS